jgi:SAM-dependent methyltransferase
MLTLGLNVGCGNAPYSDTEDTKWLNLEPYYTHDNPDFDQGLVGRYHIFPIKAEEMDKYLAGDSFDVIHMVHALEHMSSETGRKALENAYHLLKPRGYIEIETPDLDKGCKLWISGAQSDRVLGLFYGDNKDNPGQLHQTGYNMTRYRNLLTELGFHGVEEIPVGEGHNIEGTAEPEYDIRVKAFK